MKFEAELGKMTIDMREFKKIELDDSYFGEQRLYIDKIRAFDMLKQAWEEQKYWSDNGLRYPIALAKGYDNLHAAQQQFNHLLEQIFGGQE